MNWIAYYLDGTKLLNLKEDGTEESSRNIDRARLKTFQLFEKGILRYSLTLHEGQKFIFRKRTALNIFGNVIEVIYVVGYQFNDSTGKNYKVINYVHSGGLIELDDDRQDLTIHFEEQ